MKLTADTASPVILAAAPIMAEGDVTGLIAFVETGSKKPTVTEEKLLASYAMFLGKQLES